MSAAGRRIAAMELRGVKAALVALLMAGVAMVCPSAQAGTVTYYHNDLTGSPVVATNAAGQVIWRESYRPYGERTVNSAAALDNKVWFTSRRQDPETGLVYMGARYYDPVVGRFVSTDPALFDEKNVHSFNRYAYANNNPYRYVDPDGRAAQALLPVAGTLLIGGAIYISTPEQRARMEQVLWEGIGRVRSLLGPMLQEAGSSDGKGTAAGDSASANSKESGSYTNTHESGRKYHGKGDRARSQQSGRDKEKEHGDRHIATDWTPASSDRDAFADEARRIEGDRGVSNADNYNKINSPGKKYLE